MLMGGGLGLWMVLIPAIVVRSGQGYIVKSEKTGKKLSRVYKSVGEAKKRLAQIEYFKHLNKG